MYMIEIIYAYLYTILPVNTHIYLVAIIIDHHYQKMSAYLKSKIMISFFDVHSYLILNSRVVKLID